MTIDVTRWDGWCRTVGPVRWRMDSMRGVFVLWRCDVQEGARVVEHFVAYSPKRAKTLDALRAWADARIISHMRRQVRTLQRQMRAVAS